MLFNESKRPSVTVELPTFSILQGMWAGDRTMFESWDLNLNIAPCNVFTKCCGAICCQSNHEHRGEPLLFSDKAWLLIISLISVKALQHSVFSCKVCGTTFELWDLLFYIAPCNGGCCGAICCQLNQEQWGWTPSLLDKFFYMDHTNTGPNMYVSIKGQSMVKCLADQKHQRLSWVLL